MAVPGRPLRAPCKALSVRAWVEAPAQSQGLAGKAGQERPVTARPCAGRVPKGRAAPESRLCP